MGNFGYKPWDLEGDDNPLEPQNDTPMPRDFSGNGDFSMRRSIDGQNNYGSAGSNGERYCATHDTVDGCASRKDW